MEKLRLIFALLIISACVQAQSDTTKFYESKDFGWKWQRMYPSKQLLLPKDTTFSKFGIAEKNGTVWHGNGSYWTAISGGGSGTTPTLDQVASQGNTTGRGLIVNAEDNGFAVTDMSGNAVASLRGNGAEGRVRMNRLSGGSVELAASRATGTRTVQFPDSSGTVVLTQLLADTAAALRAADQQTLQMVIDRSNITTTVIESQIQSGDNGYQLWDADNGFYRVIIGNTSTSVSVNDGTGNYFGLEQDGLRKLIIDSLTSYKYLFPNKTGTVALTSDIPSGGSNVGDSLVRAFDSLAAHNTRIGKNSDSLTAHNTRIGALEASTGTGVPTYFDIIATGQSNMVNNDLTLGTWTYTTNARVQSLASNYRFATANPASNNIDYRGGITAERNNIGFAFAREWAKENTRDTIRILDRAKGSQPSSEWTPKTTGNGEITATNGMLDTLVNTLNNAPANFNAKVVLYHQGEADEAANTTWFLSNMTEIYDTLKTHAKVADDYYMIVGYPSTTYPNIIATMDSIYNRGMKDLGGRNILVVPISTGANSTIDGTHWTNETIDQIGQMDYYHYKWKLTGQKQRTDSAATIWKSGASGAYRQTQTWVNQGGTTTRPYDAVFGAYSPATAPTLARFAYLNTGTVNEAQSLRITRLAARQMAIWHESDNGSSVQTFRNAITFDDSALLYRNSAGLNRFTFGDNVTSTSQPFSSSSNITSSGTISGALYYGSTSGTSAVPIQVRTSTSGAGSGSYIQFTTTSVNTGLIGATFESSPSNRGDLVFRPAADASSTYTERMRVRGDGLVGIGTTSISARLHLASGSATASTAPLKLAVLAPALNTTAEKFAVEVDSTTGGGNIYYTNASATRYTLAKTLTATATLDFTSTAAQSSSDLTITVTGAADGDAVTLGAPNGSTLTNSCYTAWVSAANTVTVRFNNYSSGSQDPASGTFRVSVIKY